MIFVTGPRYSGKQSYIMEALQMDADAWEREGVRDVEELVRRKQSEEELQALVDALSKKRVVIVNEVGGGVVPLDEGERLFRERAGRLSCMLAGRAEQVIRVVCGLPQTLSRGSSAPFS